MASCEGDKCDVAPAKTFTLVTNVDCPNCAKLKERYKVPIEKGKIKVIDENDPFYAQYQGKKGIKDVPMAILNETISCDITGTYDDPELDCEGQKEKLPEE